MLAEFFSWPVTALREWRAARPLPLAWIPVRNAFASLRDSLAREDVGVPANIRRLASSNQPPLPHEIARAVMEARNSLERAESERIRREATAYKRILDAENRRALFDPEGPLVQCSEWPR